MDLRANYSRKDHKPVQEFGLSELNEDKAKVASSTTTPTIIHATNPKLSNHPKATNPIKRIYQKTLNWFKNRRAHQQRPSTSTILTAGGSLYTLIKNILPASTQNGKDSPLFEIVPETDDEKPTAVNPAQLDVSSPLIREAWKDDANLILDGTYSRLGKTGFPSKYLATSLIGQGSFGFVLRARRLRDDRELAVKFILRQNINQAAWIFNPELGMVPSEVHFLQRLNHPGIVQFYDFFDDGRYVYLVTELHGTNWSCTNSLLNPKRNPGLKSRAAAKSEPVSLEESPCDLFECIEAHFYLPEQTIHRIFVQLYEVVRYLALNGVVHRDLKDENVVVDADYRIKIIDFGSATAIPRLPRAEELAGGADLLLAGEGWFDKFNGTLAFAPPEVIRGMRYKGSESEVWTLGVLLFTMAFRQSPFQDSQAILYGRLDFPYEEDQPGKMQQEFKRIKRLLKAFFKGILDLLRKLLQKNPLQRIKLLEISKHPWMLNGPTLSTPSAFNASAESVTMQRII